MLMYIVYLVRMTNAWRGMPLTINNNNILTNNKMRLVASVEPWRYMYLHDWTELSGGDEAIHLKKPQPSFVHR